jgi:transposase
MSSVSPLPDSERRRLKQLARREVGRVSERIRMVLLASRGYSLAQIAAIFECDEATVTHWVQRYAHEGEAGLRDRPRSGRPRKADAVARRELCHAMEQSPVQAGGYRFGYWTAATLAAHVAQVVGISLSAATVRRLLHALTYRWRRPRLTLPLDPAAPAIMWQLFERIMQAPAEAAIVCMDECDVHLLPVLRAMWLRRAQQGDVPTPGANRKRAVFGALEWSTGRWLYHVTERKRASEFIAFLEHLARAYADRPLLVVLDNASIHHAHAVTAWLGEHTRVQLLYLPAYTGHRNNPVEKVWWRLKDQIAANRLHGSIDALVAAVHDFFATFTPEDALRLAA